MATGHGGFHALIRNGPQGVTGVGQTTGNTYQGTGSAHTVQYTGSSLPAVLTSTRSFKLIGPGPGNNLLVQLVQHLTVNANGEVTAEVDFLRVTCQ